MADDTIFIARRLASLGAVSLQMDSISEDIERPKFSKKYIPPVSTVGPNIQSNTNSTAPHQTYKDFQYILQDSEHTRRPSVSSKMVYTLPNVQEVRVKSTSKSLTVVNLLNEEECENESANGEKDSIKTAGTV